MPLPHIPLLRTARLTIRPLEKSDLSGLMSVNSDDEVTRYLPYASWRTTVDADAWYGRIRTREANEELRQYVIVETETHTVVGACLVFNVQPTHGVAEFGYVLGKSYWGKGYMQEAMRPFANALFDAFELHRLEAKLDPRNQASARLLERLGFTREGVLRENCISKGERTSSALYGVLKNEWRA